MSDPGTSYRTHEDVQEIRKTQDPISNFKEFIVAQSLATEQECKVLFWKSLGERINKSLLLVI